MKKPRKGRIDLDLANLTGGVASGVIFAKGEAEHAAWENAYEAEFATVSDSRIYIKTGPALMAYNVKTFTVKA